MPAKVKTDAALAERGKRGEVRQTLLEMILPVLADPGIPDERVGGLLRGQIGMGALREAAATGWPALPRDHGRLSALDTSYTYLLLNDADSSAQMTPIFSDFFLARAGVSERRRDRGLPRAESPGGFRGRRSGPCRRC